MLIKINILSYILSQHFIFIDKIRVAQIYEYFQIVKKCRQKMLINKYKYFKQHFELTFYSHFD
jgi:hypothetical protein